MAAIDIGAAAIDRASYEGHLRTTITKINPANLSGEITQIQVYPHANVTNCAVGIFYLTGTNQLKCRSAQAIGAVTAGYHEIAVSLVVVAGDFLGWYMEGSGLEADTSGLGAYWIAGNHCTVDDEAGYTNQASRTYSLYGIGATVIVAPTVTTQAVSNIGTTTATGNGNITDTGGENCSKRGVCWNTTGNPTVADNKSEETDSFGTGAFARPMTGLTPGQHYYVKAYAYNSQDYGYGSQVEFDTGPTPVADGDLIGIAVIRKS